MANYNDPKQYPPVDEVLEYFEERRANLLNVLDDLSMEELSEARLAENSVQLLKAPTNIGQVFFFIAFHESMHSGQLSIASRGLGYPPLFQPTNPHRGFGKFRSD